ncbi:hypothetical protein EVAR_57180_1 [Eumeta japonica]|uniref:Uncharacterized protein n=1 Tax=Eumeta variegata TaxID=151549 RepID=A0A4C1Z4I9_EUMVA|nr:hypothetical protein EVAR_57180_1 [Eumeta japonica]
MNLKALAFKYGRAKSIELICPRCLFSDADDSQLADAAAPGERQLAHRVEARYRDNPDECLAKLQARARSGNQPRGVLRAVPTHQLF